MSKSFEKKVIEAISAINRELDIIESNMNTFRSDIIELKNNSGCKCGDGCHCGNELKAPNKYSPIQNPFADHDSYIDTSMEVIERENLCIAMAFNTSEDGNDGFLDADIPVSIRNDGVYYSVNNELKKANIDRPIAIGNEIYPIGIFIPNGVSEIGIDIANTMIEGMRKATDRINYIED